MRNHHPHRSHKSSFGPSAALFVDYDDLYHCLQQKLPRTLRPEEVIADVLDELQGLLYRQTGAQIAFGRAYADFTSLAEAPSNVERSLYERGLEPCYVSVGAQRNAAEVQLAVEAAETLALDDRIRNVVIVTGHRLYGPLVRRVKRSGRNIFLVSIETFRERDSVIFGEQDVFTNVFDLAPEMRKKGAESVLREDAAPRPPRDVEYKDIEDDAALRTLEIIEEFFGQYDEVYLTPLLRKLSEEMDDDGYDPKALISDLEEAGAVYLEKRRGFPHDYTVLIVDSNHPEVERVRSLFEEDDDEEYEDDEPVEDYADDLTVTGDEYEEPLA